MCQRLSALMGVATCLLVVMAVADNVQAGGKAIGRPTIASLRARGPAGLAEALGRYDKIVAHVELIQDELNRLGASGSDANRKQLMDLEQEKAKLDRQLAEWRSAIDQIGGQRTCVVSRLYWYTDLDSAKVAAKRTGRPILSLRMLGKLTDEYSCANSRFFRTALYSNANVSQFLRDNYVLHWQSVRPVPRVTIDFGDGRKLERTLTGNSAHYVLTCDGTPLDVLPGLYSPHAFLQWARTLHDFQLKYDAAPARDRAKMLQEFHATRRNDVLRRWDFDIQRLGDARAELVSARINSALESERLAGKDVPARDPRPKAVKAARRAVGKTAVEAPILRFANLGGSWMERGMDDELWQAIANLHRENVKLDDASVVVMRQEFPAAVAARVAFSKRLQEDPVLRMVRTFENSVGLDTVRNEYLLHRRIHEEFADASSTTTDIDQLNEWVYADLFLTPSSDPWLGLAPPDVYTALENDGRREAKAEIAEHSGG